MGWEVDKIIAVKGIILPVFAIPFIFLAYLVKMLIEPSDGTLFLAVIGSMGGLAGYATARAITAAQTAVLKKKVRTMAQVLEECPPELLKKIQDYKPPGAS